VEEWVLRAMQRWPDVPALFGWLGLDRRGRWLIKGETITRPQIIDTINRNYAADEYGRWYFQNGPQRGYIQLEYAPFVLRARGETLVAHTGVSVERPTQAFLDEEGALLFDSEHGAGILVDTDLDWALERLNISGAPVSEQQLSAALAQPSGSATPLCVKIGQIDVPLWRLDREQVPATLHFIRNPQPRENEKASTRVAD
jgi:DUF2946 family protein